MGSCLNGISVGNKLEYELGELLGCRRGCGSCVWSDQEDSGWGPSASTPYQIVGFAT